MGIAESSDTEVGDIRCVTLRTAQSPDGADSVTVTIPAEIADAREIGHGDDLRFVDREGGPIEIHE